MKLFSLFAKTVFLNCVYSSCILTYVSLSWCIKSFVFDNVIFSLVNRDWDIYEDTSSCLQCSPVAADKKTLEYIGKKLKKNNVSLDIVNFGEEEDGKSEKLDALLAAVNSNDSSHIVHVPAGSNVLSDVLIS